MNHVRAAVLCGGLSLEREVSLRSGSRITEALTDLGHDVTRLDLGDRLVPTLVDGKFDVAVLALHGKAGEDGTIQSILEVLGIPYTGPDAIASALAWDKGVFKGLLHRQNLNTPAWATVSAEAIRDMGAVRALTPIVERVGCPLVVKPVQGGAFMGVRFVGAPGELRSALMTAFNYHDFALVERFVVGTEIAVGVLDGEPLPAVEIVPRTGAYDFAARYTYGATEFFAPARVDDDTIRRCEALALAAWKLAGCRHLTRADMIVDEDGVPWLLELDTCPGMTETSLVPMAAKAAGIGFPELCQRLVDAALEK